MPDSDPIVKAALEGLRLAREHTTRERRIAETLQRSLIDEPQPVPLLETAVAYVPSTRGAAVGGDWHDVIPITASGTSAGAVGDVMGHGIDAASQMGKLQAALRAFAMQERCPARVLELMNRYTRRYTDNMATLCLVIFDPLAGKMSYALAGHPPPLLAAPDGVRYLAEGGGPPLGALAEPRYTVHVAGFSEGSTLLLYTDGLVESGASDIAAGMARLCDAVADQPEASAPEIVRHALATVPGDLKEGTDDIALLAVHRPRLDPAKLELELPAELDSLKVLRVWLRSWLRLHIHDRNRLNEIVIACGEAATNAAMHAYDGQGGYFSLVGECRGPWLALRISDRGAWRGEEEQAAPGEAAAAGHGLNLMHALADRVELERDEQGTTVTLSFRVQD